MRYLTPTEATHWYAYTTDGVLLSGVTLPGDTTTVGDTGEFEYGTDIVSMVDKHKDLLRTPQDTHPAIPGVFNYEGKVVKLDAADCEGMKDAEAAKIAKIAKDEKEPK